MTRKTFFREVEVDVELSDFDDEDIEAEYKERFGDPEADEVLEKIWLAMRQNNTDTAYTLMHDYVCDKLGKVL